LALVALLRSPIVGVSDETLARLSLAGQLRARVLLDMQTMLPPAIPNAERQALHRFRDQFRELRLIADRLGPAGCAQAIVDGADLPAVLAASPDGEQRVANLLRLVERARQFESQGGDLRAFVNWLRRAASPDGEADAAEAQVADEKGVSHRVRAVVREQRARGDGADRVRRRRGARLAHARRAGAIVARGHAGVAAGQGDAAGAAAGRVAAAVLRRGDAGEGSGRLFG
jgi:hypothetical protein